MPLVHQQYIPKLLRRIHNNLLQHNNIPLHPVQIIRRNKSNSGYMSVTKHYRQGKGHGSRIKG
jgi:hypothetical protein